MASGHPTGRRSSITAESNTSEQSGAGVSNTPLENPFVQAAQGFTGFRQNTFLSRARDPEIRTRRRTNVGIAAPRLSEVTATAEPPTSPSRLQQVRSLFVPSSDSLRRQISASEPSELPIIVSPTRHGRETPIQEETDEGQDPEEDPIGEPPEPDDGGGDDGSPGPGGPGGPGGGPPGGPGEPSDPDNNPDDGIPTPQEMINIFRSMATALTGLNNTLNSKKSGISDEANKSQNRNPDVFDGSDPKKLQGFLVSLSLVFAERPIYFASDERKISYALSYLSGQAREWFEPDLLNPDPDDPPAWMVLFSSLVDELVENFGAYDTEGEAEERLGNLYMTDTEHVRKYVVRFNALASQVAWDDSALYWAFKKGLAPRIKDEISRMEVQPRTLKQLRLKSQDLDNRHWKRVEERKREEKRLGKGSAQKKNNPSSNPSTNNPKGSNSNTPSNNSGSSSQKSTASSNKNSGKQLPKKDYSDKLDKGGKLTTNEKDRRKRLGLCLYCGSADHKLDNCDKRKKNEAKGRANATTDSALNGTSVSISEPKK
jgi:hypothetical protein